MTIPIFCQEHVILLNFTETYSLYLLFTATRIDCRQKTLYTPDQMTLKVSSPLVSKSEHVSTNPKMMNTMTRLFYKCVRPIIPNVRQARWLH